MSNPSYDYQQHVLANLPNDITFKDGWFTFNKMKFCSFLKALYMKWYLLKNGYVDSGSQLSPPIRVSGAALSNNLVEGERLTIGTPAVYSGNPTPTVDYRIQSRIPPSGTISTLVTGDASIEVMLTSDHVGRQFRPQDRGTNSEGAVGWNNGTWSAVVEAKPVEPEGNAPFAMTLGWPASWSANHCPFTDWLKVARPYQTFGSTYMEWNGLLSNGHIDENGVILSIPAGADNITMFTLENLTSESGASGRFRLFYEGEGSVSVGGAAQNVDTSTAGQIDFDYGANGQSIVPIAVTSVNSGSYIKLAGLVNHNDLTDHADPELKGFRPAWLDIVSNNKMLRFKEWMAVDSEWGTSLWANRYKPQRVTYQGEEGMPIEVMCDLCNLVEADPWFMLKSPVSDEYVNSFATLVKTLLNTERSIYVEWSDKWWDGNNQGTFFYIRNLADQWFGETSLEYMAQAYAGRSSEVFTVLRNNWTGSDATRLNTVLQSWTGGVYFNQRLFEAPDYITYKGVGTPTPYSLTTHFVLDAKIDGGLSFPEPEQLATIENWIDTLSVEQVYDRMALACRGPYEGLTGYTLSGNSAFWEDHKTSLVNYPNVTVICGEGGWHLSVPYAHQSDPEWVSIYTGFVRSPQGAAIFNDDIDYWYTSFPDPKHTFNRYSDVSRPDANQSQGIQRFVGDNGTDNLQWQVWLTQQAARQ